MNISVKQQRKYGEVSIVLEDNTDFEEQQQRDLEFLEEQLYIQQQQQQYQYELELYYYRCNNYFGYKNYNDLFNNCSGLEAAQYYLDMQHIAKKYNLGPLHDIKYQYIQDNIKGVNEKQKLQESKSDNGSDDTECASPYQQEEQEIQQEYEQQQQEQQQQNENKKKSKQSNIFAFQQRQYLESWVSGAKKNRRYSYDSGIFSPNDKYNQNNQQQVQNLVFNYE